MGERFYVITADDLVDDPRNGWKKLAVYMFLKSRYERGLSTSYRALCDIYGMSPNTLRREIENLEKSGWIERVKTERGTDLKFLIDERIKKEKQKQGNPKRNSSPRQENADYDYGDPDSTQLFDGTIVHHKK